MPESASFSVRQKKANYRRRRTITVLVLIVAAVVVIALLSRGGGVGTKGKATPTLAFVASVRTVSQGKTPDGGSVKTNGDAVVKMFDDYYQRAFVDPSKWGNGQFPELKTLFSQKAQTTFTKDLNSLTIGEARTELKRVDPIPSSLVVTVYYDTRSNATLAVATASFNANGTLNQAGPPLVIHQKGTFYLERVGSAWSITAYDASQTQETPTPTPTASPT